jgi:hypothetical protein
MTGKKGKSGGRRPGAGRRATDAPVRTISLSAESRQELAILTQAQRAVRNNPDLSQRQIVEELIHAAWLEYDATIQEAQGVFDDMA